MVGIAVNLSIHSLYWSVLGLGCILQVIRYCSVSINIVQFDIDQLKGASADKPSTDIY